MESENRPKSELGPGENPRRPENLQTEWARLLLTSFADAGVTEVVISPGSRSTPFVLAANCEPRFQCRAVIDERAAAYFALGLARLSGKPALLLATSGTAGANYFPAVVEAAMGRVPLLVLTADRPLELTHCGANQTIDQQRLFGHQARRFFDLGLADDDPRALAGLRRTVAQGVFASLFPDPGAVHFNARARKPLEPPREPTEALASASRGVTVAVDRCLERTIPKPVVPLQLAVEGDLVLLASACVAATRGLIICGPGPVTQSEWRQSLKTLGERTGLPIFADPASQLRWWGEGDPEADGRRPALFVDGLDILLQDRDFFHGMVPELIIQIGRTPTSAAVGRYLKTHKPQHWVISPEWSDGENTADHLLFADPGEVLEGLLRHLPAEAPLPSSWHKSFSVAEQVFNQVLAAELERSETLREGSVAHHLLRLMPPDSLLVVGNSLPIRHVETWSRGGGKSLQVASQRGASGIDGVVSGAAGAACAADGPTALLIGDVSFLHDLAGLGTVHFANHPLVLVVIQNQGGRIFERLPVAANPAAQESLDHWLTPHDLDFSHAAALQGIPFRRVTTVVDFCSAFQQAFEHSGPTLIEAIVPPHGAAEDHRHLVQLVKEALQEHRPLQGGEL